MPRWFKIAHALGSMLIAPSLATAQWPCPSPEWLPGNGLSGTNNTVYATTVWDSDGIGPGDATLVVAGAFSQAGNTLANNIATCDPSTLDWRPLDLGTNGAVRAMAVLSTGELAVGGEFKGVPTPYIARWNGEAWSSLGGGVDGQVWALIPTESGGLVAGGYFISAGGNSAPRIARWDGTAWFGLGSGIGGPGSNIRALGATGNGDVIAGGTFTFAGGVPTGGVARWDGSSWFALGGGVTGNVSTIATLPNGDVVVGGDIQWAGSGPVKRIARWDGTGWFPLAEGLTGSNVFATRVLINGDLAVGGKFTLAGKTPANAIARWNGTSWSAFGSGMSGVFSTGVYGLAQLPTGDVIAGGAFLAAGESKSSHVARWSESAGLWKALGHGFDDAISGLTTLQPGGDLLAVGRFKTVAGAQANHVARWDGEAWSPLGDGVAGGGSETVVRTAVQRADGDVIAGGHFLTADGVSVNNIARWSDSSESWSPLGAGVWSAGEPVVGVFSLFDRPNGELVAGGSFVASGGSDAKNIARWDGSAWSAFAEGTNSIVSALVELPSGGFVAGGAFAIAGNVAANRVARWDDQTSSWSALGAGLDDWVYALALLENGDLVAGGRFAHAGIFATNAIARWDFKTATWSPIGTGLSGPGYVAATSLKVLSGGELVVGGTFTAAGGVPAPSIARWDGSQWFDVGGGIQSDLPSPARADALAILPDGDLAVGGYFFGKAGNNISLYLARYGCSSLPPCYADCDRSGGLTIDDFICFQTLFALSDPSSDCDGDAAFTIDDFICFQTFFAVGCG